MSVNLMMISLEIIKSAIKKNFQSFKTLCVQVKVEIITPRSITFRPRMLLGLLSCSKKMSCITLKSITIMNRTNFHFSINLFYHFF